MSENILKELCNRLLNLFKQTEKTEENAKSHNRTQSEAGIHINISDVSHSNVYIGSSFMNNSKNKNYLL